MKTSLYLILLMLSLTAQAQLHVDLSEANTSMKDLLPDLKKQFPQESARIRLSEWRVEDKGHIFFKGHVHFVNNEKGGVFQKFEGAANKYSEIYDLKKDVITPISTMRFVVRAYFKQLVTEIEAPDQQIRIFFPFGGPGIDHGVTPRSKNGPVFMTPFFQGHIWRSRTITSRCEPNYYKCKPFIRLIPTGTDHSLYGYHAQPHARPYRDTMERGFVSSGCFRLTDIDLYEMLTVVKFGALNQVPFEMIESHPELENAHPYPKLSDAYEGVSRWRMKEGRIIYNLQRISQPPPVDSVSFLQLSDVKRIDRETRSLFLRDTTTEFFTNPEARR